MVENVRDIIISILGILSIIVLIGLLVGMFIAYLKTRNVVRTVNRFVHNIHRSLAYVQGLAKGFNESVNMFRKGG
jgi:hypothetical protein